MKILHIFKEQDGEEARAVIEAEQEGNELELIALDQEQIDYAALVDRIEQADKLICW